LIWGISVKGRSVSDIDASPLVPGDHDQHPAEDGIVIDITGTGDLIDVTGAGLINRSRIR
jgi:hypothetical protein